MATFAQSNDPPSPKNFSSPADIEIPFIYTNEEVTKNARALGLRTHGSMQVPEFICSIDDVRKTLGATPPHFLKDSPTKGLVFDDLFGVPLNKIESILSAPVDIGKAEGNATKGKNKALPSKRKQTTKRKKVSESSKTSFRETTTTTTTTTTTLSDGTKHTTTATHSAESEDSSERTVGAKQQKKRPQRRQRMNTETKRRKRELRAKLIMRVMEAYEDTEFSDDSEEDENAVEEVEHEEADEELKEVGDALTSIDELEKKKKELNDILSSVQKKIASHYENRETLAQDFEELGNCQQMAKEACEAARLALEEAQRRFQEAEQSLSDISERRQNKKALMIKVDGAIESCKKEVNQIRLNKRELIQLNRDAASELLEKVVSSLRKKHKTSEHEEAGEEERVLNPKAGKAPILHTSAQDLHSSAAGKTVPAPFIPDPLLATSSSDSSTSGSEDGADDGDEQDSSSCSESEESSDGSTHHYTPKKKKKEGNVLRALDWDTFTTQQLETAVNHGDSATILGLAASCPEVEDKPFVTGVILNDSTCVHCGLYDTSFFSATDPRGFICPNCKCGNCGLSRDKCEHEAFWTEFALMTPVRMYEKVGMIEHRSKTKDGEEVPKKKKRKDNHPIWTRLSKSENLDETIVHKFNRMRRTLKSSKEYEGRQGVENEFKRWFRRYIIHCFGIERLEKLVYNIFLLSKYVYLHRRDNPDCKPFRCIICQCRFIYTNEEKEPGSRSTTGNGTSHRCCTGCKNFFSNTYRLNYIWCKTGRELFYTENKKVKQTKKSKRKG